MENFLYVNETNSLLNLAAMFIELGMIVYTSLYRRRGKPEDKLFFVLLVSGVVYAVVDEMLAYYVYGDLEFASWVFLGLLNLDFLIFGFFTMIWCIYLAFRNGWHTDRRKKYIPWLCLPGLFMMALMVMDFLLYLLAPESTAADIVRFLYYYVTDIPIIFAFLFSILVIRRYYRRGVILMTALFAVYLVLTYFNYKVASDPIIMSIALIYAHLYTLREPFYEEVTGV